MEPNVEEIVEEMFRSSADAIDPPEARSWNCKSSEAANLRNYKTARK